MITHQLNRMSFGVGKKIYVKRKVQWKYSLNQMSCPESLKWFLNTMNSIASQVISKSTSVLCVESVSGQAFKRERLPKSQRADLIIDPFRVNLVVLLLRRTAPFSSWRSAPILPIFHRAESPLHACPMYLRVCLCTVGEGGKGAPRNRNFETVVASRPSSERES